MRSIWFLEKMYLKGSVTVYFFTFEINIIVINYISKVTATFLALSISRRVDVQCNNATQVTIIGCSLRTNVALIAFNNCRCWIETIVKHF